MNKKIKLVIMVVVITAISIFLLQLNKRFNWVVSEHEGKSRRLNYCQVVKNSEFKAVFSKIGIGKYGKKTVFYDDGITRKPYGLWQEIGKLKPGDLVIKKSGTFDYIIVSCNLICDTTILMNHGQLPCK